MVILVVGCCCFFDGIASKKFPAVVFRVGGVSVIILSVAISSCPAHFSREISRSCSSFLTSKVV